MFYKNAQIFCLKAPLKVTSEQLEEHCEEFKATSLAKTQSANVGWTSPFGEDSPLYLHVVGECWQATLRRYERLLPAAIVNDALQEKIKTIEANESRTIYRKERARLKDEVTYDLLPRAFVRRLDLSGYIDLKHQWIIIDSPTRTRAETWVSLMQDTLGTLPITPLSVLHSPEKVMTRWLQTGKIDKAFHLEDYCFMLDPQTGGGAIRCSQQDLLAQEIQTHLQSGKQVLEVALTWRDKIQFVCDHKLSIKRIKFLDLIKDSLDLSEEMDAKTQQDATFAIMSGEFSEFFTDFFKLFGDLT